jgi:uncharacterized membrane protein YtjA (UPF0391 family)
MKSSPKLHGYFDSCLPPLPSFWMPVGHTRRIRRIGAGGSSIPPNLAGTRGWIIEKADEPDKNVCSRELLPFLVLVVASAESHFGYTVIAIGAAIFFLVAIVAAGQLPSSAAARFRGGLEANEHGIERKGIPELRYFDHTKYAGVWMVGSGDSAHYRPVRNRPSRFGTRRSYMLRWTLTFLLIALVAAVFGFGGIAVAAAGIARILFFIFLILFVASLMSGLIRRV